MASLSYDQWVDFTFARIGPPNMLDVGNVPGSNEYPGSVDELCQHCLKFFLSAAATLKNIPRPQICAALEVLPSIDGYLGILSLPAISFATRAELASSHFELFRDVFSIDDYDSAGFMWWEWLVGAEFLDGPRVGSDEPICVELLKSINRILYLPSECCQMSALHGINELTGWRDPVRSNLVNQLLESKKAASQQVHDYAMSVLEGNAQ